MSLARTGHFYEYDEGRFLLAGRLIDDAASGDYRASLRRMFEAHGRPGFILTSILPTALQRVVCRAAGVDSKSLHAYDIAAVWYVFVSLAVSVCVFLLARAWTGSCWYGLLVAIVHGALDHPNAWIGQFVPFDTALLLLMPALMSASSPRLCSTRPTGAAILAGALSALGFSCYPGYYAFVVINGAVLVATCPRRLKAGAVFAGSFGVVILAYELLARLAGVSYVHNLAALSTTVRQGLFSEGYVFFWRYLRDVEGPVGVLLLVSFAVFAGKCLRRRPVQLPRPALMALGAAVALYAVHATMGVVFQKVVVYGRLLGMYLPFLTLGAVLAVFQLRRPYARRFAACVFISCTAVSFVMHASARAKTAYPAEVLFDTLERCGVTVPQTAESCAALVSGAVEELRLPMVMVADAIPGGSQPGWLHVVSHAQARASAARFIGVNFVCVPYFSERETRFVPPEGYRLVAEARTPLALPSTVYEGRRPRERNRLVGRGHQLRIYELVKEGTPLRLATGVAEETTAPSRSRAVSSVLKKRGAGRSAAP